MDDGRPARKASFVFAANLAGAALGYAGLLVIGRYVEPAAYGLWLFGFGASGLFAVLSNLGLGQAHQRHVAQGVAASRALGVLVRLRLLVGLALVALFLGGAAAWAWLHEGPPLTDATTVPVLAVAVLVHLLAGSRQVLLDTWLGQQRVDRVESLKLADTAIAVVLLGNVALLLAHLGGRWEVVPGVGAFWAGVLGFDGPPTLGQAALLVAACYAIAKALTLAAGAALSLRDHERAGRWDGELARSYVRLALPLAASGALVLVLQYTDTLLLGFFWTAREVGLYGSAQRLSSLGLLAATAAVTVLFPRFAQLHAQGRTDAMDRLCAQAERYLLLVTVPVASAMVALPQEGLHVAVGDKYLAAARPLQALALWALVTVATMPLGARLMAEGRTRLLVVSAGLNAGLNVAFNLVLIPTWGFGLASTGAALATLLSTSLSYVYLRVQARRTYAAAPRPARARILLAGGLAAAAWAGARDALGPAWFDRVWELAGWGLAGGLLYLGVLAATGGMTAKDWHFLRGLAHPRELMAELRGR